MITINGLRGKLGMGDIRYNEPKEAPKADAELVERTILATEIYRRARLAIVHDQMLSQDLRNVILQVQAKQVAYGLDKYPEPLNPNTWDVTETVDHILDESMDKLHYLVMLRIKLEQALVAGWYNDTSEVRKTSSRINRISQMIHNTIEDMGYLITMHELMYTETEARPNDAMHIQKEYQESKQRGKMNLKQQTIYADDVPVGAMYNIVENSGADFDGDILRVFTDDELKALAEGKSVKIMRQ